MSDAPKTTPTPDPHAETDPREILLQRIRDPKTSARDLASLSNSLARLEAEDEDRTGSPSLCPHCLVEIRPEHLPFGVVLRYPVPPEALDDVEAGPDEDAIRALNDRQNAPYRHDPLAPAAKPEPEPEPDDREADLQRCDDAARALEEYGVDG